MNSQHTFTDGLAWLTVVVGQVPRQDLERVIADTGCQMCIRLRQGCEHEAVCALERGKPIVVDATGLPENEVLTFIDGLRFEGVWLTHGRLLIIVGDAAAYKKLAGTPDIWNKVTYRPLDGQYDENTTGDGQL